MARSLHQSIQATLAYFDMFSYPLTAEELYQWLWQPPIISYEEFLVQLQNTNVCECIRGMYVLPGREHNIDLRQDALHLVEKKMRIAKRAVKKMRWVPFVRAVFLCNTVASGGVSEESDIDVFIVVKNQRLWLTRFLVSAFLGILRMRRTSRAVANKICLSFYVTENNIDLSHIAWGTPDIYLMYWVYQLIPLYDPEDYLSLIQKKNTWIRRYIPHGAMPYLLHPKYRVVDSPIQARWKRMWEYMWGGAYGASLELQAKKIQKQKMQRNTHSVQDADDTRVVVTDAMLKFHENDRRVYYRDKWYAKLADLDI